MRKYYFERRTSILSVMGSSQRFTDVNRACEAERRAILHHRPPYNKNVASALGNLGKRFSDVHRKKIGDGNRGKVISAEAREASRKANTGRVTSAATKEKQRNAALGKKRSEAFREKMRQIAKLRPPSHYIRNPYA